ATLPRGSVSALVRLSRHRYCTVVEPLVCKSGANDHMSFCWNPATLHGGCVRLRGRWEGGGVTGVVASVLLFVAGCALVGIGYDRMLLRATVFVYFCCCLLFLF
ncbi:hypothetical protein TcG_12065, partial [Trypanosoma cruzi]